MITTDNTSTQYHIEVLRYEGDIWDRHIAFWTLQEAQDFKKDLEKDVYYTKVNYKFRIAKIDTIITRTDISEA